MDNNELLKQILEEQGRQAEWMHNHEEADRKQFSLMPTLADFDKLAKTEDIARLNNIVHNFTIAAELLSSSSKWASRFVIGLASLFIAVGVIKVGLSGVVHAVVQFLTGVK